MKKITKRVLMVSLVLLIAALLMACSNDSNEKPLQLDEIAGLEVPRAASETQDNPEEPLASAEAVLSAAAANDDAPQVDPETTSLVSFFEAATKFSGENSADTSLVMTFGFNEDAVPLTLEEAIDVIMLTAAGVNIWSSAEEFFNDYAIQLLFAVSLDESLNMAMHIGLPMQDDEFFHLLELRMVENTVYIGIGGLVELLHEMTPIIVQMIADAEGLSPLQTRAVFAMVEDILARFDGIEYISVDVTGIPELEMFSSMLQDSLAMNESVLKIFDDFMQEVSEKSVEIIMDKLSELAFIEPDEDGDFYVFSFDQKDMADFLAVTVELLKENAGAFTDAVNALSAIDMFGMGMSSPEFALTEDDMLEFLNAYDPAFFDDFYFEFAAAARATPEMQETYMSMRFAFEDISLFLYMDQIVSPRTAPIGSPQSAISLEEFLALIDDISNELGLDLDLYGALPNMSGLAAPIQL